MLAPILRDEDVAEVLAAGREDPLESLKAGFNGSALCLTVEIDSHPHMMFGVVLTPDPEVGYIWMLSSPEPFKRHSVTFLRQSRAWITTLHGYAPILTNSVDARNKAHIEWLRWLGFSFINKTNGLGEGNLPFITFARIEHV